MVAEDSNMFDWFGGVKRTSRRIPLRQSLISLCYDIILWDFIINTGLILTIRILASTRMVEYGVVAPGTFGI